MHSGIDSFDRKLPQSLQAQGASQAPCSNVSFHDVISSATMMSLFSFHEKYSATYECPAATCGRTFKGRRDNFKTHLLLHIEAKSTRTPYDDKAAKCYDEMFLQKKKRRKSLKAGRTVLARK